MTPFPTLSALPSELSSGVIEDTPSLPRFFALVPCAGFGERSGAPMPKQYRMVAGRSVVSHTLAALAQVHQLTQTLVVLSPGDRLFESHAHGFNAWVSRTGGESRAQTVNNGLDALLERGAKLTDWVLVHDAARCLVRPEWINALISACADDAVGGLLALPVSDTLKYSREGRVDATLERTGKWQAQTPQMFRLGVLQLALKNADPSVTDESSARESIGMYPMLVRGSIENFKVTFPPDFELAERLLKTRTSV
jgi:2-C-methyl-D-erythritol 4-phosphate cytidylyltransferase